MVVLIHIQSNFEINYETISLFTLGNSFIFTLPERLVSKGYFGIRDICLIFKGYGDI